MRIVCAMPLRTSFLRGSIIQDKKHNANIAIKTVSQLFSKIPGCLYIMDGSGNQLNISTRGLDLHRSWEFVTRQNGVIINSDIYGYPASH
jgi:Fe(3+) dicitrate transport protein